MKNYGLDLQKELSEQSKNDYIFGSSEIPDGLADEVAGIVTATHAWSKKMINGVYQRTMLPLNHCVISWIDKFSQYYPIGEIQKGKEDYMDCVTRGINNELEKQLTFLYQNNIFNSQTCSWLEQKGFVHDNRIVLSNRIPAIMSGTTRTGNSFLSVLKWIENNGIHPRAILPREENMTWDEYHNRNDITDEMLDLGKESREYIKFNYARLYKSYFAKLFGNFKWKIFDNYLDYDNDFVKVLAENYIFYNYGYKLIINEKKNMITKEILEDLSLKLLLEPYNDGMKDYIGREYDFVVSELMKSERRKYVESVIREADKKPKGNN